MGSHIQSPNSTDTTWNHYGQHHEFRRTYSRMITWTKTAEPYWRNSCLRILRIPLKDFVLWYTHVIIPEMRRKGTERFRVAELSLIIAKYPREDGITAEMIHEARDSFGPFLFRNCNTCITRGYFPARWKKASPRYCCRYHTHHSTISPHTVWFRSNLHVWKHLSS